MSYRDIPDSKSGWLLKQSRGDVFMKNWRKRYIILEAGKLAYFVNCCMSHNGIITGTELKGELNLENAKVFQGSGGTGKLFQKNDKKQKQLYIVAGTDEHNLYLEASSAEEAEAWIKAFESHAQFATSHPSMVPQSTGRTSNATARWSGTEESSSAPVDTFTTRNHHAHAHAHYHTAPEDFRFNNDVLKTTITPTAYGILLKTRDESSQTIVFMSVVSHPLCHDNDNNTSATFSATHDDEEDESTAHTRASTPSTPPPPPPPFSSAHSKGTQPLAIVHPRCWYFSRDANFDYSRRTATKLGLRHYCEPALVKDGEPYVVMQVLISSDIFLSLLQEIQLMREAQKVTLMEMLVSPQPIKFIELQKMYSIISTALMESHQVSCHKIFSVVHVEEQEYQPYFVSPMELIIGRNGKHKQISFFTSLDNIQRHTESLLPLAGVQLLIRGQGIVPPKIVKEEINIIINLNSHAVCDKVRDLHMMRGLATKYNNNTTGITSSHLKESSQRDLNHTLEECSNAIFLWNEAMHYTDTTGQEYYSYNVTTNTTIIRLCKLDNFDRQQQQHQHQTPSATPSPSPTPLHFRSSTATGPGTTDIVTMYLLQSLSRYFNVKLSGYTSSMKDVKESATDPKNIKPVKIIKFSNKTRLASPLFTKEKHISNNYDSLFDVNDIDFSDDDDDDFEESQRPLTMSSIYSQDSFSLSAEDVLFTDVEFFSCKLKEMTNKGSNILDALENELSQSESESQLQSDNIADKRPLEFNNSEVPQSYKCVAHVITAELPTYVLDFPMEIRKKSRSHTINERTLLDGGVTPPAVMTKVRRGDKINIFGIKECSESTSWLLLDSGWIPGSSISSSSECDTEAVFKIPTALVLLHINQGNHEFTSEGRGEGAGADIQGGAGEEVMVVECLYEALQCKGKGVPFRRHFKSDLAKLELNPFSYDKSADNFTAVPIVRLLRQRSSIDEVLFSLKSQLSVLDVHDDDDAELQEDYSTCSLERAQEYLNKGLMLMTTDMKMKQKEKENTFQVFLTPTKEDMSATEDYFKCHA